MKKETRVRERLETPYHTPPAIAGWWSLHEDEDYVSAETPSAIPFATALTRRVQRRAIHLFSCSSRLIFMLIIKTFKPIITSNTLQLFNQNTHRPFTTKPPLNNMPLIDPVTTGAGGDKTQEWQAKLVGKKLGEASDEVVCICILCRSSSYLLTHY